MATTSNRAPLLVTLVIVLGVGGRWLRGGDEAPKDPPVAIAALDSQLALVEQAGEQDRGVRDRSARGRRSTRPSSRDKGTTETRSSRNRVTPSERGTQKERAAPRDRPTQDERDAPRAKGTDRDGLKRRSRAGAAGGNRDRSRVPGSVRDGGDGSSGEAVGASGVREERTPMSVVRPEGVARLLADRLLDKRRSGDATVAASTNAGRQAGGRGAIPPSGARSAVDVESASAAELERLPRVGPALARRIVSDRSAHGPFGSLEGLQRVRGIGPAMARQLQGYVTFGGTGRP